MPPKKKVAEPQDALQNVPDAAAASVSKASKASKVSKVSKVCTRLDIC